MVALCRASHVKGLVWPLCVEFFDKIVRAGLLLQEIGAGWLGGLQLECEMHAFVAAVLLRMAWLDALDVDAEPEPPDRQPRQIEQSVGTGEGHAIVGSDRLGQAELLEAALEHGEGIGFLRRVQRLASQEIATGEIGDRQWIAVALVGEHELALVIGAPQVVGLARLGERCSLCPVASSLAVLDQPAAIKHRVHGRDRRRLHVRVKPRQSLVRSGHIGYVLFLRHSGRRSR